MPSFLVVRPLPFISRVGTALRVRQAGSASQRVRHVASVEDGADDRLRCLSFSDL